MWSRGDEALYQDPAKVWHRVRIDDLTVRTATIEYFDNSRRGERWKNGRRYNHATRTRVVVYQTELHALPIN